MNLPLDDRCRILVGDCRALLATLPDGAANCCVTSPPYFGLRDYGHDSQIGAETTPAAYVAALVAVMREVRRVLRDDGTCWLNLGDSYANDGKWGGRSGGKHVAALHGATAIGRRKTTTGLKPKDLIGIPWRVAFALQDDGWYLRSDIIWNKPNPMPESVTDRCTRAHEYVFLLSKSERYAYDAAAISEPAVYGDHARNERGMIKAAATPGQPPHTGLRAGLDKQRGHSRRHAGFNDRWDAMERKEQCSGTRNRRDVWTIAPAQYDGAHFATMPQELARLCILAGCPVNGTVLDPFAGAGTTGLVALQHQRRFVGCELNPEYARLAEDRIAAATAQGSLLDVLARTA